MPIPVTLTVNGVKHARIVEESTLLLDFLRDHLGLTGTRAGCDAGHCGACVVLVNNHAVKACTALAAQADGAAVVTIEGLAAADGTLHPMQAAFRDHHPVPCGLCTPGMVMTAIDLVQNNPHPTEQQVRDGMDGIQCHCTGWHILVQAVMAGATAMRGERPAVVRAAE